jgi:predicted metal-binding membrane protein
LNTPPAAAVLPRRDRTAILAALAALTLLCWVYLIRMARRMESMSAMADMPGMDMTAVLQIKPWEAADWAMMIIMWVIMMVGMMLPSATPMILIYAAISRKASRDGSPLAPTAVFATGYIVMWCLFSVVATIAQWALDQAALLSPMMVSTSPLLGAGLVIAAGIYQLTPLKDSCLDHCRAPARFISEHWRAGGAGAFWMGAEHGLYCLGCCWVLMGLLFVGGVMSLAWIAGLTLFVLAEKLLPLPGGGARIGGLTLIAVGVVLGIAAL